jgi:ArsR family transcriptional regulator, arsenate/arsenite/antimonite-responsive transcriptional repressor
LTAEESGLILTVVEISNSMRTQEIFRALADPNRRRILEILRRGSLTAGEIAERFDISMASLSHHYAVLRSADLIRSERRGQQVVYSLNTSVMEDVAVLLAELFAPLPGRTR